MNIKPKQLILPLILICILLIFLEKNLIYLAIVACVFFILYDMLGNPFTPRIILVNDEGEYNYTTYPTTGYILQRPENFIEKCYYYNDKVNLGGGGGNMNTSNTRKMRDKFIKQKQGSYIDNTWISTSSNVNPESRMRQENNVRPIDEFKNYTNESIKYMNTHPTLDATNNLNIDTFNGGFNLGTSLNDVNMNLQNQHNRMNDMFIDNTNIQREYMGSAANEKVRHKLDMRDKFPTHHMFGYFN
jgi:hypothetical protein